eukprot:XP_017168588.1 PREDICTED: amyotrophic lateral sclerosis 2 chromosomal region candidate gene 12 protein homolog [Mus musculus]
MDPNPFIYCTCCDYCKLGPTKLIKTPYPLPKTPTGQFYLYQFQKNATCSCPNQENLFDKAQSGKNESSKASSVSKNGKRDRGPRIFKLPQKHTVDGGTSALLGSQFPFVFHLVTQEVIQVSPGYTLIQNQEQISVTLGDEMFNRKKHLESDVLSKVKYSRTDIISDLQEQIAELMAIIEQMNRDQQSALKLLSKEMDLCCSNMKQKFETKSRELKETHREELERLENNYKEALKAEKALAEEKLGTSDLGIPRRFHHPRESLGVELKSSYKMGKEYKYLKSIFRVFQELLRQHDEDILQIQELRKSKEILEAELRAQATVLETLNTNLYKCQKELERQKTIVANLEKLLQTKLAEAEEKHKYNIKTPTEENNCLRQKMLTTTTNEETSEISSANSNMYESDVPEHNSNKKQTL